MKNDVVLSVETAIRLYRKYAQKKIKMISDDLTLDQSYILSILSDSPDTTQVEMSELMDKDNASMSRISG